MKSISYMALEHDVYTLDALPTAGNSTSGGTEKIQSQKINGFNGKNINRMLIIQQFQDPNDAYTGGNSDGFANMGSFAMNNQSLQVKVNGANVLPSTRKGNNSLQALHADSWGKINGYYGCGMDNARNVVNLVEKGNYLRGSLAYLGLNIMTQEVVSDLQIELGRNALNHTDTSCLTNKGLIVHVYCEVPKSLIVKKGEYDLVYN